MAATKTRTAAKIVADSRVRIVHPDFFVRCGYPLSFEAVTEQVYDERRVQIEAFLKEHGVKWNDYRGTPQAVDKVAKAIAYELIRQDGFGGRERTIHTETIPEYAGRQCRVKAVRFVKTGTYTPGSTHGSYDGLEYDPPYLSNEQTHRILFTDLDGTIGGRFTYLEIEAAKVELIDD